MAALCSCGGSPSSPKANEGSQGKEEIVFATDSFKYSLRGDHCRSDVAIDYPINGPQAAVDAIRSYIKSVLFDDTPPAADDPMQWVRDYCAASVKAQEKSLEQMGMHSVSKDEQPEEGIEIRKVWQTSRLVTYSIYRYSYFTDGAHGEYSDYGVTWRLSDGHRLNESILTHVDERLYGYIREGLKRYFEIESDAQLQRICTVDLSLMPMPTFPPYLVENGVRFHYSIYDVCPFEWGDPAFTIPYEDMMPYLSDEAKELLKQ